MNYDISRRDFCTGALAAGLAAQVGAGAAPKVASPHVPGTGKIGYRVFWTWDNSHNWCETVPGMQDAGIGSPYTKAGEWFERDYKRSVDWCAANGIDAVGCVGLIRDCHGGLDAARRVCAYAREKGVRVYLISGLYTYGGVYYEGDSHWSMDRWFETNRDAIGRRKDGSPLQFFQTGRHGHVKEYVGCPSCDKLNRYILDSLAWVFTAIPELGGIQMETGDTQVCWCDRCRERRGAGAATEGMSVEDMTAFYPAAVAAVRSVSPDAWIMCETYHHFLDKPCAQLYAPDAMQRFAKVAAMPKDVFWQWKCDRELKNDTWKPGDALPPLLKPFRHMMRAHSGSQWWGGRASWAADLIRRQCQLSYSSGICGVSMFGEMSPYRANSEFNYLALQYFSDHPDAPLSDFARDVMSPRLGGDELAAKWCLYAPWQDEPKRIPEAVGDIARFLPGVRDRHARRRWMWLANHLSAYRWNVDHFPKGRPHPRYTSVSPLV